MHPGYSLRTDKKENQIFLIYKEIQSGAVAKSYMRKDFLIYDEMRKYFPIYEEAVSQIWLCNCSILNFLIYEENLIFFFLSVRARNQAMHPVDCPDCISSFSLDDGEYCDTPLPLPLILHTKTAKKNELSPKKTRGGGGGGVEGAKSASPWTSWERGYPPGEALLNSDPLPPQQ